MERIAAMASAIGPAYMIPSMPRKIGSISMKGNKKKICLVKEIMIPNLAFPIDAKKLEVKGCMPLIKVRAK